MKLKTTFDATRFPPLQDQYLKLGLGSFLILLTLLGLINQGIVAIIINVGFGFFIGQLRFLGYLFFIGYGLALFLNRPFLKLKWSLTLLGISLAILSLLAMATVNGLMMLNPVPIVSLSNFSDIFIDQFPDLTTPFIELSSSIGGGIIGYFLVALMATLNLSSIQMVIWITLLIVGIALSLELMWLQLIRFGAKQLELKQKEKAYFQKIAEAKPSKDKTHIYAEPLANGQGLQTYRSLFPGQSVQGLSKVQFQKTPSSSIHQSSDSTTLTQTGSLASDEEVEEPIQTASLSSTYEAPDVPQHVMPTIQPTPLVRPNTTNVTKSNDSVKLKPYQLPSLEMLDSRSALSDIEFNEQITKKRVEVLNQKFMALGIEASIVDYQIGPAVTAFDVKMAEGAQISQVKRVLGDLAVALGGFPMSLKELVPGKTVSQLEVLNERISMVGYKELLEDQRAQPLFKNKFALPFGRNILGEVIALTPKEIIHLLVAGSSGSGKTVFVHSFLTSILMTATPSEAKILLIDPKKFELSKYKNLPHLLAPIISDFVEAKIALERLIDEMESRYEKFLESETISLETYNQYAEENKLSPLPLIFAVIDEYNDLINVNPQISDIVQRLAQKSRAAGIHLLIATQRPTTNILTGSIKNNLATIVALRVSKQVDSITMLGHAGAEILGGNGDMYLVNPLFARYGEIRVQAPYISDSEIQRICAFIRNQALPQYDERFLNLIDKTSQFADASGVPSMVNESFVDPLYAEIKAAASVRNYVSMSWISRTYSTGYPRALKIFKQLQQEGIIDGSLDNPNNNRGRKVLVNPNFKEEDDEK
ncbi:MAG: translocase [Bacillota bacterium]|jgi:S-DNA-T family DNA segregation ATPase FtsK/SpoIIIE